MATDQGEGVFIWGDPSRNGKVARVSDMMCLFCYTFVYTLHVCTIHVLVHTSRDTRISMPDPLYLL